MVAIMAVIFCFTALEAYLRLKDPMNIRSKEICEEAETGIKKGPFRNAINVDDVKGEKFRILALGDSFTFGDGIQQDSKVWPMRLEGILQRKNPGMDIKVINMGICGLTTVNEYELLVKVGQRLKPDIIIIQYLVNDILPSGPNLMRVDEAWLRRSVRRNIFRDPKIHRFLSRNSFTYAFINSRFRALQRKIRPGKKWDDLYREGTKEWASFKRALVGIRHWAYKNKVKPYLVLFPVFHSGKWSNDDHPHKDIYDKVGSLAHHIGLEVIDLWPVFIEKGENFRQWRISDDNGHPNEDAHEIFASGIYNYLAEKGKKAR